MVKNIDDVVCPCCKKSWPWNSEQAICIEEYDKCIVCKCKRKESFDIDIIRELLRDRREVK